MLGTSPCRYQCSEPVNRPMISGSRDLSVIAKPPRFLVAALLPRGPATSSEERLSTPSGRRARHGRRRGRRRRDLADRLAWLDPVVSLVVSAVIVISTWALLENAISLALNAVPEGA